MNCINEKMVLHLKEYFHFLSEVMQKTYLNTSIHKDTKRKTRIKYLIRIIFVLHIIYASLKLKINETENERSAQ